MFFEDCGARGPVLVIACWKTTYMQSAHACAVQTAFQALPTRPRRDVKDTRGTQKHKQWRVSISKDALPDFYIPSAPEKANFRMGLAWLPPNPLLFLPEVAGAPAPKRVLSGNGA